MQHLRIVFCCFFLLLVTTSCRSQVKEQKTSIRGFDLSQDDERILYSLLQAGTTRIYELSLTTNNMRVLITAGENKFLSNPRYSPNGKKILFIEYDKLDMQSSTLCISNSDGTSVEQLVEGRGIISEAIFSEFGDEIFFTSANEYSKSSPIGIKAPHGYDIYSISLGSKELKKLSQLNAYGLHHLFELDSNSLLLHKGAGKDGGMMLFEKKRPQDLTRIVPENDPRNDPSLYDTPVHSSRLNKMVFIAPYQLYIMDVESRHANLLYDNRGRAHIQYVSFFNQNDRVLFSIKGRPYLYSIGLDGKELVEIDVR